MEDESGQEKTEDPTAKRVEDFRDEGKVAQSKEITSVCVLFGASLSLYICLRHLMIGLVEFMDYTFRSMTHEFTLAAILELLSLAGELLLIPLLPPFAAVLVLGFTGQLSQVGWNVSAKSLEPKLEKLNPISGIKRVVSGKGIMELIKGMFKMAIVGALTWITLRDELVNLLLVAREGIHSTLDYLGQLTWAFTVRTLMIFAVMAALDYLYQRWDLMREMKMTKQEVKDESKNREGDQQTKMKMRNMVRQMLAKTGVTDVPQADVVITNPSHYAVALRYKQGLMDAPVVVARGADRVATRIKDEARRCGIPRIENRQLARALYQGARVGDPIPIDLYNAVAEVLAHVYRIKNRRRQ